MLAAKVAHGHSPAPCGAASASPTRASAPEHAADVDRGEATRYESDPSLHLMASSLRRWTWYRGHQRPTPRL